MRVAILHDWIYTWRGGEKCLEQILLSFPEATVFTLFASSETCQRYLPSHRVITSIGSSFPYAQRIYRGLLPLYPFFGRNLERKLRLAHAETPFDLVISISHCAVKNVRPPLGVPHICYCLTPVRYIWDQYDAYFKGKWYEPLCRLFRQYLQSWDVQGSEGVTQFVAISDFVAGRIKKYYARDAVVIYPPVDVHTFGQVLASSVNEKLGNRIDKPFFLMVNALVPYKKTSVVVEAFRDLPYQLKIVGEGPEHDSIARDLPPNVALLGSVDQARLTSLYQKSKGLIYAAEEDFGIAPVEAQAAGKPVLCYAKGGCSETVEVSLPAPTGKNFSTQDSNCIRQAVKEFASEISGGVYSPADARKNANKFSILEFSTSLVNLATSLKYPSGDLENGEREADLSNA